MRAALLFVLCVTSASAQDARLTRTERIVVAFAGAASTLLVPMGDDLSVYTLASPALVGVVVYGAGRALGGRGRLGPTLGGAALGALPAIGLFAVSNSLDDNFLGYLGASVASVVGPAVGATIGFDRSQVSVSPSVLHTPDGEQRVGLALRASF